MSEKPASSKKSEIDVARQRHLEKLYAQQEGREGVTDLREVASPLTRADLEWLLSQHPTIWLSGAILAGLDLKGFPLSGAYLWAADLSGASLEETQLQGATLKWANLSAVRLVSAQLQEADLRCTNLEHVELFGANLEGANFGHDGFALANRTNLSGGNFRRVQAKKAVFTDALLKGAVFYGPGDESGQTADLSEADFRGADLAGATLTRANLQGATLTNTNLQEADLTDADLAGADLANANLQGATLTGAKLAGATLTGAKLAGATLTGADLRGANLREAFMDGDTTLAKIKLDGTTLVANVVWNSTPLVLVDWEQVPVLGDELRLRTIRSGGQEERTQPPPLESPEALPAEEGTRTRSAQVSAKTPATAEEWRDGYHHAADAYLQLAAMMRAQGIDEAAHYVYRGLIMRRKVFWWQLRCGEWRRLGAYLFSLFLAVLTGYGYRLWRIVLIYLLINLCFGTLYWTVSAGGPHPISLWEALYDSTKAIHQREFNPLGFAFPDGRIFLSACEAVLGLVLEATFIAMLTQRFFNR